MPQNTEKPPDGACDRGFAHDPAMDAVAAEWFARRDTGFSVAQKQTFQRWLADDPRHGAALARLESAWSLFGKPARTGGADELLHELATRAHRKRCRRAAVTAAMLFALIATGLSWRFLRNGEPAALLPATAAILAPAQQILPDGSEVVLNKGAQIAVHFTQALRLVELRSGGAYFRVVKNHARPFVVAAGGHEVRAVGTSFSVHLGMTAIEVLVAEGTVAVAKASTSDRATPGLVATSRDGDPLLALAGAGNRIVIEVAPEAAAPRVTPVDAAELDEDLAWCNPRVEFTGTPLAEAVAFLNREAADRSGLQLAIADPTLGGMRVSGIFRTDNTDAFVLLLEAGFGVKAERSGQTISLRKAVGPPRYDK